MSIPVFNVPNAPGVPPMVRSALSSISNVQGLVAGVGTIAQFLAGAPPLPTWGIFDSNFNSVVTADSFMSFAFKKRTDVPTFQVQGGKLAAYNKISLPFDASIRITRGGTQADRQQLIAQLDALIASLDNFIIVTPEKSWTSANCIEYDLTRKDEGDAYFFSDVELYFQEIPTTTAIYTTTNTTSLANAQQANAQGTQNNGVLNSATPSPAAQSAATTVLAGGSP